MRTLYAELKKSRRRHNLLVAVCIPQGFSYSALLSFLLR